MPFSPQSSQLLNPPHEMSEKNYHSYNAKDATIATTIQTHAITKYEPFVTRTHHSHYTQERPNQLQMRTLTPSTSIFVRAVVISTVFVIRISAPTPGPHRTHTASSPRPHCTHTASTPRPHRVHTASTTRPHRVHTAPTTHPPTPRPHRTHTTSTGSPQESRPLCHARSKMKFNLLAV